MQRHTVGKEAAEEAFVVVVVDVGVLPEGCGWETFGHGDALFMRRLVKKLIRVVLLPWRREEETKQDVSL